MASNHFALGAFDAIAVLDPLGKSLGLLLLAARLQMRVMFSDFQSAMFLVRTKTLRAQGAVMAVDSELEAIDDSLTGALLHPAALRVLLSRRTNRLALLHLDLKIFAAEFAFLPGCCLGRPNHFPTLRLGLSQYLGGDVRSVHILHRRFVQAHRGLFLLHLLGSG